MATFDIRYDNIVKVFLVRLRHTHICVFAYLGMCVIRMVVCGMLFY